MKTKSDQVKSEPIIGVVAFAFGMPSTVHSNILIADIARDVARNLGNHDHQILPVFTQTGVRIEAVGQLDIPVEYLEQSRRYTPTTLQVARGAVRWAMRRGITKIIVVAARPHLKRCMRDMSSTIHGVGAEIEVTYSRHVNMVPIEDWFCQDSLQPRTRSRRRWWIKESILKVVPFFIYKLIAC